MELKIGIVGTNFISDRFCEAAGENGNPVLYAVYSRKEETGRAFAEKHSIPHVFIDYESFLSSGLDAVYIASPNFMHCSQTISALNHGKHVLCEKIMAINEQEVLSMIECARQNNVILLEAMRPDFDPALRLVEDNLPRIGRLRRATFEFCQYSTRYDSFREGVIQNAFNPELGNAAIMDIGVYCIHSIVRMFGMPKNVRAFSTKLENGFDGSGIVLMEYDNMIAEAVYSKISSSVNRSVIQGEDGSLLIAQINEPKSIELRLRQGTKDPWDGGISEILQCEHVNNNMIFEIKKFISLIENNEINHKYLQYSLDTMKVIDEARRQAGIVLSSQS